MQAEPRPRLDGLDALRGLAAGSVLVGHATLASWPAAPPINPQIAHTGVALFFLLSGYLIANMIRSGQRLGSYGIRRVLRIYPAYLAALIGIAIITGNPALWHNPLGYLTFTQPIDQQNFNQFIGVAWTLKIEVLFYLLAPILFALRLRFVLVFCLASLVAAIVVTLIAGAGAVAAQAMDSLPFRLWEFTPGIVLAYRRPPTWMGSAWIFALSVLLLMVACTVANPHLNLPAVAAGGLAVGWILVRQPRLGWWASAAAAISYSLYLWHGDLLRLDRDAGLSGLPLFVGGSLLAITVAAVMYFLIERPSIYLGRWLTRQGPQPHEQAVPARQLA